MHDRLLEKSEEVCESIKKEFGTEFSRLDAGELVRGSEGCSPPFCVPQSAQHVVVIIISFGHEQPFRLPSSMHMSVETSPLLTRQFSKTFN